MIAKASSPTKESPGVCAGDMRIGDRKSSPRFTTPRCRLHAYSGNVTIKISLPDLQTLPHLGARPLDGRSGAARSTALFKSGTHGFGGGYSLARFPTDSHLEIEYP
jgi:hypothetical protein